MNYAELVAALPLPTPKQTASFARHVADNHSWYKHLPPFPPGATFVFFLNPHAGETVEESDGGFVTRPLEEGDYFRHHSRLSTSHYRSAFGHWDYWVNNPRAYRPAEEPFLYGVGASDREPLPDDLTQQWSCRLTAFLKFGWPAAGESGRHDREAFEAFASQNPTDPDVERYRELAIEVASAEPRWDEGTRQAFRLAEAATQRQLVLQTLLVIRDDLARMQCPA